MNAKHTYPSDTYDENLRRRIETFLVNLHMPGLRQVSVEVKEGRAIVSGRVRTFYEKQLATSCCQRVAGVLEVINNVDVAHRGKTARRDEPPIMARPKSTNLPASA